MSITETLHARNKKQKNKVEEIIQLAELPVMSITGNSVPAFKLYKSIIIPTLLLNCLGLAKLANISQPYKSSKMSSLRES